jgi:hypothetical protein
MVLKCVTCGLLFRSRNELDWHIREEHLGKPTRRPVAPAPDQPAPRTTLVEDDG